MAQYGRWRVSWLMESGSTGDIRWPSASLYDTVVDDPMSGARFFPRDPLLGGGVGGRGEPWVMSHSGGTAEMPAMIEVGWTIGGETMHQPYDVEART